MDLEKRFEELTGISIAGIIHSVVGVVADRSSHSLEESRHAPKSIRDKASCSVAGDNTNFSHSKPILTPPTPSPQPSSPHQPRLSKASTAMAFVADVDDTAAFMAAARAFRLDNNYGGSAAQPSNTLSHQGSFEHNPEEAAVDTANDDFASTSNYEQAPNSGETRIAQLEPFDNSVNSNTQNAFLDSIDILPQNSTTTSGAHTPVTEGNVKQEEDRENMITFSSWGTPAVRDKAAAQVRRIIIKGLPPSWGAPDKVLSLIHGGLIENVSITPSGNAHVLFCEHSACKAFYDKYPNGIVLDKERKLSVFVDMGTQVDVVSSNLSFNLSVGSTRVVRAVGVDMEITMTNLFEIASANNRRVEKIVDTFVPGCPRIVNFRFCSIDDAVRFRAALVRSEEWEHCNVQYTTDPCEVATGYHSD
ncbi:hypothetical protein ARAM_006322 [Aspergillus rambellii]|uniref:Uncharacterized protein n=2 Tax=Aspergillus subgen. Nidulantes TaxID=2720870 RepID=A0A0F8UPC6_9EURO|nr:hypothetical protein ARAM_006322 [Aspergillus rambellii]KKK22226.1 hypothetical protein AOCH_007055 [Aspergillus ochraceoroseus]